MLSGVFYHRLALAMRRTVPELLESMTSAELTDWAGYYALEPWGNEWRAFARLAAWVAASAGSRNSEEIERGFMPVAPIEDDEPDAPPEPQQTPEERRAVLRRVMQQFGGGGAVDG
jgi:hypothetical protein